MSKVELGIEHTVVISRTITVLACDDEEAVEKSFEIIDESR